jgi:spermidine synthase
MSIYKEDLIDEFGVTHQWNNVTIKDSIVTHRGTKVEMIERPNWGLACYMDNSIQSCEVDERIYHEALVHPVMMSVNERKRVMIIGGGEGATAREVLKWSGVEKVDMYEWDKDIVTLFKTKYPQWAKGAWYDERLNIIHSDIFKLIKFPPTIKYDVIIIDLFEPCEENKKEWKILLKSIHNWITMNGSIVMYAGMRNIPNSIQPYQELIKLIEYDEVNNYIMKDIRLCKDIIPYRVHIPSFTGESTFLLLKHPHLVKEFNFNEANEHYSHITQDVWNSYKTFNW